MKLQQLLVVFVWLILPSLSFAANYYVDCNASKNGNGSYSSPWNNLNTLNSKKFNNGDGLYFKVGTTCTLKSNNDRIQVNWSGTGENNRAVIGAYYGNGLFGLNGKARPIIDGNNNQYPGTEQGAIDIINRSYVTVRDLKVQNAGNITSSGSRGIRVIDSNNINVENSHIWRPRGGCIVYSRVKTGKILNNNCHEAGHPSYAGMGAAIELTAANSAGATTNILVKGNKVFNSKQEGIGLYKKVTNCIVEYNTVRDIVTGFIYIDAGKNNIIRHNLVYESVENVHKRFTQVRSGMAIAIGNEASRGYVFSGNNQIYGNLVAGTRLGISLGCEIKTKIPNAVCHQGVNVYNNTFVDNDTNIAIFNASSQESINVKNNISSIVTKGIRHLHNSSPAGVTWSHNLFYGGSSVAGKAATNMISTNPMLAKNSGWRNLSPDSLTGREFLPGSNQVLNGGTRTDSGLITAANFNVSPIQVSTIQNQSSTSYPIGAWILPKLGINPPTMKTVEQVK